MIAKIETDAWREKDLAQTHGCFNNLIIYVNVRVKMQNVISVITFTESSLYFKLFPLIPPRTLPAKMVFCFDMKKL